MSSWASIVVSLLLSAGVLAQTYTATYTPDTAPDKSEQGQSGTNRCGTGSSQTSQCQNVYFNSVQDFCLWGPPELGSIGAIERIAVAYCLKNGYGTRLFPDGTITGAHFVQTPDYIQITGVGDLTKINITPGDGGGELDPHGADGNGNPVGGLVFSSAFGPLQQIHEWTNFMGATEFCFRACKPGPLATQLCEHIYDIMGCAWNMPANYGASVFEQCQGVSGEPMGIYGNSTFHQGDSATPPPHPAPSSSNCQNFPTVGNGLTVSGVSVIAGPTSSTPAPSTTSAPSTSAARVGGTTAGAAGATTTTKAAGSSGAASVSVRAALGYGTVLLVSAAVGMLGVF